MENVEKIMVAGKEYTMKESHSLGVLLIAQTCLQKCMGVYKDLIDAMDDEAKIDGVKQKAQQYFQRFMKEAFVDYDGAVDFWSLSVDEFTAVRERFFPSPSVEGTKS